jgi:hypothetical protein
MRTNNMSERRETLKESRPAPGPQGAPDTGRPPRRVRLAGFAVGIAAVVAVAVAGFWISSSLGGEPSTNGRVGGVDPSLPAQMRRPIVSAAGLVDRSGVKIVHVAITGGGGLIDLRYQVVDPDKAAAVHDEATPPAIVDETTHVVVNSLLMGHLHAGVYKTGVTYYLVFENPGNLVQRGSRVSVLLGEAQVQHVPVQ